MKFFVEGHAWIFEALIGKQTNGNKVWQRAHNYPRIEYSYMHVYTGSPDYIGNVDALMLNIDFQQGKPKFFRNHVRMGCGFGYVQKPFDRLENHKDITIGSHINFGAKLEYMAEFNFSPKLSGDLGFMMLHFSNTLYQAPNLGINLPMLSAALTYKIPYKDEDYNRDSIPRFKPDNQFTLNIGFGVKDATHSAGHKYLVANFWGDYVRRITYQSGFGGGFDLFYDSSIRQGKLWSGENPDYFGDIARFGIHATYEFIISDVSILQQAGIYLVNSMKADGAIYNRTGIRYHFAKHWAATISMKAHITRADFFELSGTYVF